MGRSPSIAFTKPASSLTSAHSSDTSKRVLEQRVERHRHASATPLTPFAPQVRQHPVVEALEEERALPRQGPLEVEVEAEALGAL